MTTTEVHREQAQPRPEPETGPVVNAQRLVRVLDRFAVRSAETDRTLGRALCDTAVDVLEVRGAGITLRRDGGGHEAIGASTADMAVLHELERTLGEGPCVEAFERGEPASEPDLANPAPGRWVAFAAAAARTEARAAFGYPLQVAGTCVGALNLYTTRPGPLDGEQHADALVVAAVVTHVALSVATHGSPELLAELLDVGTNQLEIHQATGMVAVQISSGMPDALARLRAHAFAEDRSLSAVAADVVARRLRFQP